MRVIGVQTDPSAKPSAGSTHREAKWGKVPDMGAWDVISPIAHKAEYATEPTIVYASSAPAGPALASADPEPRKRPVPMVPAIYARFSFVQSARMERWLILTAII
jgi:hypothetical protein